MASSTRIEELRKKFEENPRRYFAPLANEYRKAGDIEQAIAICREYLPQQPGHMSGHIVYGQALFEAKQAEEAKTVFETALTLDPENLIALRHLGDIALLMGDSAAARTWYGRVLEADPRNEEIQAQLASLDQGSAPTPVASAAVAQPSAPAADAVPTVEVPVRPPSSPVTASSPTAEVRLDSLPGRQPSATATSPTVEIVAMPKAPPPAPPPAAPPPPPAMDLGFEPTSVAPPEQPVAAGTLEIDSPVSSSREAPPLESFSLDGLETTSLSAEPPAASPPPPPPAPVEASAPAVDLDFGPPSAAPVPPPAAEAPMTVDLDFGTPAAASAPAPAPPPAPAAAADDMPLLDIGELPSAPAPSAAEVPSPPAPSMAETPIASMAPVAEPPFEPAHEPAMEAAQALDLEMPAPGAAAPLPEVAEPEEVAPAVPESGPFVTETMAELYLQQGHRDEALRVYRALLEQRPGDATLSAKVAALSSPPASPVFAEGPTIRELLMGIAQRRPGYRPQSGSGNGSAPAAGGEMVDALAAFFGTESIGEVDELAAVTLGQAFMSLDGLERGAPAPEPSLDAVLTTEHKAQPAAPSSFSFDQFFSQRASAEHEAQPATPPSRADGPHDDVAQFNQWLQGLKQR